MRNKRVLLSGGSGFIGSHLAKRLFSLGADVSVIVKYKSVIDNIRLSSIWNEITIFEADLRNIDSLRQFKNSSFDYIFHLAAYNHVGDSFLHVSEALTSSVIATANFLEYSPKFDKFVYMSTSEVYGYQERLPFTEEMTPHPISPYSIGKYAGELYSLMKRKQDGRQIACVRAFNTFGPYQSERAVIPELIINCLRGALVETTEGLQTREFNYVENIVDGLLAIVISNKPYDDVINLGSNQEVSICDLVKLIHQRCNSSSELRIGALETRPTEIWRMRGDNRKANQLLKWSPKISFKVGLDMTIEWYKDYLKLFYNNNSPVNLL